MRKPEQHKLKVKQLSIDDHEIVELLGHYDSKMLESRMRTLIEVVHDCTTTKESEIFIASYDNTGYALAMMN